MQTQKPLSAFTASELVLANFPACVFAITPASCIGTAVITDQVGSVVFTLAGGGVLTNNGNGSFSRSATAGSFSKTSGTMPTLGTSDGMLIVIGTLGDAGQVSIGDPSGGTGETGAAVMTSGGVAGIGRIAGNFHTLPNLTKAGITAGGIMTAWDNSANTGAVHVYDSGGYETTATTPIGTIAGTWAITNSALSIPVSTTLNGIYYMKWTDVPPADECKRAIAWMSNNPTLGLYPGWLNRT